VVLGPALYTTRYGSAYVGDSLALLDALETDSVDLVVTSPPFALQREKSYGNVIKRYMLIGYSIFAEKYIRC